MQKMHDFILAMKIGVKMEVKSLNVDLIRVCHFFPRRGVSTSNNLLIGRKGEKIKNGKKCHFLKKGKKKGEIKSATYE